MRDYVLAGEVAAILGLDTKTSPWAIWNKMTEEAEDQDIGDRGRWQGRLAREIAFGIAKDHKLRIEQSLEPAVAEGIMPSRAWKIEPSLRTGGQPAVLVVQMKTQQQMFGWKAPDTVPPKPTVRLKAIALAYGVKHVFLGTLIDGYRSELYHLELEDELAAQIRAEVGEMIRMVIEDDEPVVDYDLDRSAIRSGKTTVRADASAQNIKALAAERADLADAITKARGGLKGHEQRRNEIDTMLIHLLSAAGNVDVGSQIISIEEKGGRKTVKVTEKSSAAEALF
ncbi:hypothetical protein [Croceicoccus gelatinilyticus]|uniref:hypothetical protein n=1 Tax=Croceicoccus gelatinilyticus TaxID=2835536 RepID=UPI001BCBB47F|nr:hypothetical protein [Croceicoccus gelatinilyticus]MBS7671557.1 hypothetical protein [Croceicoccus gelatinilyticus]